MFKYKVVGIVFVVFIILGVLAYLTPREQPANISKMPNFQFYSLKGSKIDGDYFLKSNWKIMVMYYDPHCEYCEKEITLITQNANYFADKRVLLVTNSPVSEILKEADSLGVKKYPFINILWDKNSDFKRYFGSIVTPSIYIYNQNKLLTKEYHGAVIMKALKAGFISNKNETQ